MIEVLCITILTMFLVYFVCYGIFLVIWKIFISLTDAWKIVTRQRK